MDGSVTLVQAGTETLPCVSVDILRATDYISNLDLVMFGPSFCEHEVKSKCPPLTAHMETSVVYGA